MLEQTEESGTPWGSYKQGSLRPLPRSEVERQEPIPGLLPFPDGYRGEWVNEESRAAQAWIQQRARLVCEPKIQSPGCPDTRQGDTLVSSFSHKFPQRYGKDTPTKFRSCATDDFDEGRP